MGQLEKRIASYGGKVLVSRLVAAAALLVFFILALQPAISQSSTADEGAHILRAQVLRQTNQLGLQGQHTPLGHWLIGTFFFTEPSLPDVESLPSWPLLSPDNLVSEFLWQAGINVSRLLFLARLPVILSGLIIGAILASWSQQRQGTVGLTITMVLFAFSPNLLASASLATTDLVAAAGILAAIFALWHYWRKPSFFWWLLTGLAIGMAIGGKLTGLLVIPLSLLLSYSHVKRSQWWKPGLIWLSFLPAAAIVVWIIYGFEIGRLGAIPLPAATYINNFVEVQQHIERGHYSFLLGERSNEGWWSYFAVAYLVKTPAIVLILLLFSLIYLTVNRRWRNSIYLWLPAVAIFLAASYSRLNIGFRHMLAMVPFIWLLIGETAPWWRRRPVSKAVLTSFLAIYAIGSLRVSPHFLAYFNEVIGGPSNGPQYLGDSNIDWGQDLTLLADYMRDFEGDDLKYSYFGASDTAYYGIDQPPVVDPEGKLNDFAPANPAPGTYAISVNHLQTGAAGQPDLFDWFRGQEPIGNLGYSILLFEVETDLEGSWVAHCLDPVAALDEGTAEELVGENIARHLFFDCRTSWVIPDGDQQGWYILPPDLEVSQISPAVADNLVEIYHAEEGSGLMPYRIYHWSASADWLEAVLSSTGPLTTNDGSEPGYPLQVEGMAELLGGMVNETIWGSAWSLEAPSEIPLSVLLHLHNNQGAPAVADGLGFSPNQWQSGDILLQYNDFGAIDGVYLETGLYDFTTLERFPFGRGVDSVLIYPP